MLLAGAQARAEPVRRAARHAREGDRAGAGILAGAVHARRAPIYSTSRPTSPRPRSTTARPSTIAPGVDMYYWSLGDVYRGSNRLEEARRYYQLALQLDPQGPHRADQARPRRIPSSATSTKRAPTTTAASPRPAPPTPASSRRSRRSRTSMRAIRRRPSRRSRSWSTDIDGFGAAPDQRLNAKVTGAHQRGADRAVERPLRRRAARARARARR